MDDYRNHEARLERHSRTPSPSGINDLFDYNVGIDEVLKNINAQTNLPHEDLATQPTRTAPGAALGLDEEVKVSRKRRPVAKLDEARLLSLRGIPRLRSLTRSKLKLKGKGYEFSDAACLLNLYQLWLDDLYPRAKFNDGLTMIEKLGHSKRIQIMRREWITEGRPKVYRENSDDEHLRARQEHPPDTQVSQSEGLGTNQMNLMRVKEKLLQQLDLLPNSEPPTTGAGRGLTNSSITPSNDPLSDGGHFALANEKNLASNTVPGDDDLDELLAEHENREREPPHLSFTGQEGKLRRSRDDFQDELEVLADLDVPW